MEDWILGKITEERAEREKERDPPSIDSCLVYLFMNSWRERVLSFI